MTKKFHSPPSRKNGQPQVMPETKISHDKSGRQSAPCSMGDTSSKGKDKKRKSMEQPLTSSTTCSRVSQQPNLHQQVSKEQHDLLHNTIHTNHSFRGHNEIDALGMAWRTVLLHLVLLCCDDVNARRLTRPLQLFLPFLTGHETFVLAQVIEAMGGIDTKNGRENVRQALENAIQNRNVSRILVQNIRVRFDFLWHWSTMVTWNRWFDAFGQLPFIGITSFPATENFPSTRNHALASMFRILLGPGNWPTRVITRGREGLITDNPENTAQNLAAESNGFELANRNQFGTYFGRRKLNDFRFAHRLPTDESLVRTFVAQPMNTLINNGVVHVLRQLAKHWHNMLNQSNGNFSHQRMEQLGPFETLRFHVPEVLVTLASLRGRNHWDSKILGPMIQRLQQLSHAPSVKPAQHLVRELQTTIIPSVCAGIPALINHFQHWMDAVGTALVMIEKEAYQLWDLVQSVQSGIQLGYHLFSKVNWKVPSDRYLENLILDYIDGKFISKRAELRVRSALQLTTPRDKRTLIELVKRQLAETEPAKLLLGRVKTLLQRELRREHLNQCIREMSVGSRVSNPEHGEWYWLLDEKQPGGNAVYEYDATSSRDGYVRYVHVHSGKERTLRSCEVKNNVKAYIPVAEAITHAQKAYMQIELEHGHHFTYGAFMEFSFLRTPLRRLAVVAQLTCEELDNARLNLLKAVQLHGQMRLNNKAEKVVNKGDSRDVGNNKVAENVAQSICIIGGGPTGLVTAIHCAENVLASGGTVRLFEARDSFAQGGSSFERAQIVRLDARWISMLRYHLGTGFEDVFIPASGETDSQLGNTLPTQGFVEITIKDLESLLHTEVSRLWSKGLLSVFVDSKAKFDSETNLLTKLGKHLKVNDCILRQVDADGAASIERHPWRVVNQIYAQPLGIDDLQINKEYGVYIRQAQTVLPFRLVNVCLKSRTYTFQSQNTGVNDVVVNARNLPSIYEKDSGNLHTEVHALMIECSEKGSTGQKLRQELRMSDVKEVKFFLDTGDCHVIEAIGKPRDSNVHFRVTTPEPYGVLCMQGLKVSMGMHNFGGKRWGTGILDDIRSQNDTNTRIIGDFTKMVRLVPILTKMHDFVVADENWRTHFVRILAESPAMKRANVDAFVRKIERSCKWLADHARSCRRQTLQTRFFETGDNFYLGMEFPREYDHWKKNLSDSILEHAGESTEEADLGEKERLKDALKNALDCLWYEACLETIRTGDVYNPGARHRVPRLYLIDSYFDNDLASLPVGESFRILSRPEKRYEIVVRRGSTVIARDAQGMLTEFCSKTQVRRGGNLARTPDGNNCSKVAISTFPVSHYVNHRTLRMNDAHKGFVFAFIGDEQATPHFMRYSGLTGACINAMLLNNFIRQSMDGVPFTQRFAIYSKRTHWSSVEVVHRGTGGSFGEDGFLRPGFSYDDLIDYLHARVVEHRLAGQNNRKVLKDNWLSKLAASLVPRGMELHSDFVLSLRLHLRFAIFRRVFGHWNKVERHALDWALLQARKGKGTDTADLMNWKSVLSEINCSDEEMKRQLQERYVPIAESIELECFRIIQFASSGYIYNERISSELFNQPKPVDTLLDDFAVEAQNLANSLVLGVALSSAALAFRLLGSDAFNALSATVSVLNIIISFDTMTNVARYKIRNEEARILYFDEKFCNLKKATYGLLGGQRKEFQSADTNPFLIELDCLISRFQNSATYYDCKESDELKQAYKRLTKRPWEKREIRKFQRILVSDLIVDKYHVNSYLQEKLVGIYKSLENMLHYINQKVDKGMDKQGVHRLFEDIESFSPHLEKSLQRGSIRWGFMKRRKFAHWDMIVVFRYFGSLFCRFLCIRHFQFLPIETATKHLLDETKRLASKCGNDTTTLRREVRDLEELNWATHESDIASMIFVSAFLGFAASVVFTTARIFSIPRLEQAAFWATVPSASGAILATFHFVRKLRILGNLWWILRGKVQAAASHEDRINISKVCSVTLTQIFLTFLRLMAATTASVALPFSLAENGFGSSIGTPPLLPFWMALAALCMAIGATIFFFIVEYVIRYNLSPKLPVSVLSGFRDEIHALYWEYHKKWNDIDTKQVQERETWEYVAREFLHRYRFDTVFAADRFGAILQYIQCGMESEEQHNDCSKDIFLRMTI